MGLFHDYIFVINDLLVTHCAMPLGNSTVSGKKEIYKILLHFIVYLGRKHVT